MTTVTYRPLAIDDAAELAAMHLQALRETYAAQMPESFFAAVDLTALADTWRAAPSVGTDVTLALLDTAIVGFVASGEGHGPALPQMGEVYDIYVLARAQRRGIGRRLMAHAAKALAARGLTAAGLWVVEDNAPARRFYEALQGRPFKTRVDSMAGRTLRGIAYGWEALAVLTYALETLT
jgi:ribosomal protein S18 acetylase RimI-like enzyme